MKNLLFCLFITFCFYSKIYSQVTKQIEPTWVNDISYLESEIDEDEVTEGVHVLLFDNQVNIPNETIFYRLVTKITDNVGIQNASTINISYDPTYQALKFHKISIIRNGEVIDKLNISNIQVMRRELNAENYLYDGSLSAVMNISDVRTDDIIDYSYSIIGFNPIHNNAFSSSFYLNDFESIGKINTDILSKKKLKYKLINTLIEPVISKANNLYKYHWEAVNTKKVDYEESTPAWKLIYESVFISEYDSWKDVVDWGVAVFKLNKKIDSKLQTKIDEINSTYETNGGKIKSTLDFVQNEIRYLGLESGIGSYKPFPPNQVFNQRFGDCKDKSLLMVTMLNKMGIEAYPMIVNTVLKHNIKELLPSPKFFNHCVIKVIDGKREYYYDPTIPNQGGDYDSTHFPNYEYGLVLKKGNESFDEIRSPFENKVETFEEYTLEEIGKGAHLKVITTYHEYEADKMRNYFKNNSINAIDKEYKKFYSNYYYNVSSVKPPSIKDKLRLNVFEVHEEYQIDSIWQPLIEKEKHIAVSFTPTSLLNTLYVPTKDKRKTDLAILFPILREHRIKVNLPTDWTINNDKLFVNSPGFYFEWTVNYNKKEKFIDLNYYLKPQKSYITTDEYDQYNKDVRKVDQSLGYYIYIPENYTESIFTPKNSFFEGIAVLFKFLLIIGVIVVIVLFIFLYSEKRKRSKNF